MDGRLLLTNYQTLRKYLINYFMHTNQSGIGVAINDWF